MALSFGVTVLPDPPYSRMIELIQLAEQQGFEYAWTYDSHVLWQESFPVLALVAELRRVLGVVAPDANDLHASILTI